MALARTNFVSLVGVVAILFAHGAQAAPPQILGLVATATPTPLTCENGKCWAEFSAFCLQQHRKSPDEKTVYVPAADTKLTLQVTAADGSVRTVDAASLVTIESERVFLSVRIGLPESVIREMNGAHAAISVGKLASLVPAVTGGAGNPMTAAEIAHFTGPMRAQAEHYVQSSSARDRQRLVVAATALKLLNAVGNAPFGTDLDAEVLWRQAVGTPAGGKLSIGLRQTQRALLQCHRNNDGDGYLVGACLGSVHDINALPVTKRVWNGRGAGG